MDYVCQEALCQAVFLFPGLSYDCRLIEIGWMNKASGGDGIPAKQLKILKHDAALNMPANLEYSAMTTGLEKVSFHSNAKKGNAIECSNYCAVVLISHAGKVVLKILQAGS